MQRVMNLSAEIFRFVIAIYRKLCSLHQEEKFSKQVDNNRLPTRHTEHVSTLCGKKSEFMNGKTDYITQERRRLHNEELNDLCSSPNIIRSNQEN